MYVVGVDSEGSEGTRTWAVVLQALALVGDRLTYLPAPSDHTPLLLRLSTSTTPCSCLSAARGLEPYPLHYSDRAYHLCRAGPIIRTGALSQCARGHRSH